MGSFVSGALNRHLFSSVTQNLFGFESAVARAAGVRVLPVPSNSLITFAGDSRTFKGFIYNANQRLYLQSPGPAAWARPFSGNRFRIAGPQYGVGSDTTTLLLARWSTVLADPAGTICLWIGSNDISTGVLASAAIANITTMINQAKDAGKVIILSDETPKGAYGSTAERTQMLALHNWLAGAESLFSNVVVWSTWGEIIDPATVGTTETALAGTLIDNVHLSSLGAKREGATLASTVNRIFPPVDYGRAWHVGDANAYPALNANPAMTGITGTNNSPTSIIPRASDGISTGWTAQMGNPNTLIVDTYHEIIDGVRFQTHEISGTSGADNTQMSLIAFASMAANVGKTYDFRARIKVDAGQVGVKKIDTEASVAGSTVTSARSMTLGTDANDIFPVDAFDEVMCTPEFLIVTGAGNCTFGLYVQFLANTTVSAKVRVAEAALRESPFAFQ